jgi:uncharacterized protein
LVRIHEHFEWDEDKAEANLRKHGVSFDEAASALADEDGDARHLDRDDPGHADGEDRYITYTPDPDRPGVVYVISWTDRSTDDEKVTRIISARKATKQEKKYYAQELGG